MFPAALGILYIVLVQNLLFLWMWVFCFFLPRVFDAFSIQLWFYFRQHPICLKTEALFFIGALIMGPSL
jgi:hypothetical protein